MRMTTGSIVVIGGGIVGASAARHLARQGVKTVLVDRRDTGRATSAGAGIVAPGTSLRDVPAFYDLAQPAVSWYPELIESLREDEAGETGYAVCGKLFLAQSDEEVEQLGPLKTRFEERQDAGMPNLGALEIIDGARAQSLFPALRDVQAAMWIPDAARVDGAMLREAMTKSAVKHGARFLRGDASLVLEGGNVTGVVVDGSRIAADAVVLAAGSWTNAILAPAGVALAMSPQKGQIVHVRMPGQETTHWPILGWFGNQYILTFAPDRVVAGATRETGSGYDTRVTPGGVKHVLDTALRIAPGIADGSLAEVRVGLRPFADDGVPFIGPVPGIDNLVVSTGHGPSGLQLGPYSGVLAADLALGQEPAIDLSAFRLDRPVLVS
jgi:D-amino-acid dehydrogenase